MVCARRRLRARLVWLVTVSETISLADEAALSWYFGQGLSIYEQSTFGAILRKLDRDGFGSEQCGRCEGAGILEAGGVNVANKCKTCGGDGRVARRWCQDCGGLGTVEPYEVQVDVGGWCPKCAGTGSTPISTAMRRTPCGVCGTFNRPDRRPRVSTRASACSNCIGSGFEPITAQPIHEGQEAAGVQADDSALTRFAITSRRVAAVHAASPALAVALSVYYGDIGQRWAMTDRGRVFSLYHMTGPGKKLAKWGEKASNSAELGLTSQERIGTQAALDAEQPKQERRALLAAAGEQAAALYARAAKAWNRQASSKRDREDWMRLMASLGKHGHDDLAEAIGLQVLGKVGKAAV